MPRARVEYSVEGKVSPERFIAALVDFTPDRSKYWPVQNGGLYKVVKKGKDWARVREGQPTSWELARYDWSKPGVVISTVEDSNFMEPGSTWEFRVKKRKGGGCHVDVVSDRVYKGPVGLAIWANMKLPTAGFTLALILKRTMQILEQEAASEK